MHEPVLLSEVINKMSPKTGERYLDATAGYGGHAQAMLKLTNNYNGSVLVDRDKTAYDYLVSKFESTGIRFLHKDFYSAAEVLINEGAQFDLILADLGVSSQHLSQASRGFSFRNKGPLDMRMDKRQPLSADIVVNTWSAESLERILRVYGEEPQAKRIANAIVQGRPIADTTQLAKVIEKTIGHRVGKHPATRSFQAIRIAVNDELGLVEKVLPLWLKLLSPGGRIGIISFHSLEDRIVKRFFLEKGGDRYDADLQIITKQPIVASPNELVFNPRSRSAKFRVAANKNIKERTSDEN